MEEAGFNMTLVKWRLGFDCHFGTEMQDANSETRAAGKQIATFMLRHQIVSLDRMDTELPADVVQKIQQTLRKGFNDSLRSAEEVLRRRSGSPSHSFGNFPARPTPTLVAQPRSKGDGESHTVQG